MWRWIAVPAMVVLLSGCAQKAVFETLTDGSCSKAQSQLIGKHISGQIDALAKEDWKLAYSFASAEFRAKVELHQFIYIIGTQYSMLIKHQSYQFDMCTIAGREIMQDVSVKSGTQVFTLTYTLSVKGLKLGIESATTTSSDNKLNV